MELWVWDWDKITVMSGGWWLFLIGVLLLVLGALFGYWSGYRSAKERYETFDTSHLDRPRNWGD